MASACKEGLEVNEGKTKYSEVRKNSGGIQYRDMGSYKISNCDKFLGVAIDEQTSEGTEIETRLLSGYRFCWTMKKLLSCTILSKKAEESLYTII